MIFNDVKLHRTVRVEVAGSMVVVARTTICAGCPVFGLRREELPTQRVKAITIPPPLYSKFVE
jgi:hypothetical protein